MLFIDDLLKETQESAKHTEMSLNQQLQRLQAELNEKEFELSKMESRNAWAGKQQQEILDKLKEALNEKNRTIEVGIFLSFWWDSIECLLLHSFRF
jgi:sugar-specific transcriptional regulator TrmB